MKIQSRVMIVGLTVGVLAVPGAMAVATPATAATVLTTAQISLLQSMTAEEKLAGDVYDSLAQAFPERQIFTNIGASEDKHLAMMRSLLGAYGVEDPTLGDAAGVLDDATVQQLFEDLVNQGQTSIDEAAEVGLTIERMDIEDLSAAIAQNFPADVTRVLTNLRAASQKHLAAFSRLAESPDSAVMSHNSGATPAKSQMGKKHGASAQAAKGKASAKMHKKSDSSGRRYGQGR